MECCRDGNWHVKASCHDGNWHYQCNLEANWLPKASCRDGNWPLHARCRFLEVSSIEALVQWNHVFFLGCDTSENIACVVDVCPFKDVLINICTLKIFIFIDSLSPFACEDRPFKEDLGAGCTHMSFKVAWRVCTCKGQGSQKCWQTFRLCCIKTPNHNISIAEILRY